MSPGRRSTTLYPTKLVSQGRPNRNPDTRAGVYIIANRAHYGTEEAQAMNGIGDKLPGYAVGGALVVGVSGLILALLALIFGNFAGAGLCLIAAALAFGLLANAIYRR